MQHLLGSGVHVEASCLASGQAVSVTVEDPPASEGWMAAGGYSLIEASSKDEAIATAISWFVPRPDGGQLASWPDGAEGDVQRHPLRVQHRDGAREVDREAPAGGRSAVAQPHHVERFLRRQHRAMAGAGVVGMAMGDHGPLD